MTDLRKRTSRYYLTGICRRPADLWQKVSKTNRQLLQDSIVQCDWLRCPIHCWDQQLKWHAKWQLTFFGLLSVTRVMPGTCFNPSLAIDFRAFFSLREWTWIDDPAGIPASASPVTASCSSESELLEASSTSAPFFAGGSSGSSSIRGFDIG